MSGARSIIVHGHFYQPPRENPWFEEVEAEPSAAPFHNWNERIERECYRTVVAARVLDGEGRIARILNALEWISFNVGPTLLEWLERHAAGTYADILAADRASARRTGHGNAIAMPYHHAILPLASRRDKMTEVRWGIADFRRRFGREPAGMWLPETAVDHETLEVVAQEGIAFTIVAPHQVEHAPSRGLPGIYRAGGGRHIALFVYDGGISHDVAFGPLLKDAELWLSRMLADAHDVPRDLVAVATDGETYGHHHPFGEMALAWLIDALATRDGVRIENFAGFLARHPPSEEVALVAPSSWSCPHGVERWRAECGCRMRPLVPTQQKWRAPLRDGLNGLRDGVHGVYEREAVRLLRDPWEVRDSYGTVVGLTDEEATRAFVADHAAGRLDAGAAVRARELLELERNALRMFTSCGWFFDDIAGIESQQVLRYAARAVDLLGEEGREAEARLLATLSQAPGNDQSIGTGRIVYERLVKPRLPAQLRAAGAHAALRHAGGDTGAMPLAFVAEDGDGTVTLRVRRTGRRFGFRCGVDWPRPGRVTVSVTPAGGEPVRLSSEDFPERQLTALKAKVRHAIMEKWFAPEETALLAGGDATPAEAAARALVRAVRELETRSPEEGTEQVVDLCDLLDLLGEWVPFEAPTAFHRLASARPPDWVSARITAAVRLGFSG